MKSLPCTPSMVGPWEGWRPGLIRLEAVGDVRALNPRSVFPLGSLQWAFRETQPFDLPGVGLGKELLTPRQEISSVLSAQHAFICLFVYSFLLKLACCRRPGVLLGPEYREPVRVSIFRDPSTKEGSAD